MYCSGLQFRQLQEFLQKYQVCCLIFTVLLVDLTAMRTTCPARDFVELVAYLSCRKCDNSRAV